MRANTTLNYLLVPANKELFDDFIHDILMELEKSKKAGFSYSIPCFIEFSTSSLYKYATYYIPEKNMTLENFINATLPDPQNINYFIRSYKTKDLFAYISIKVSNNSIKRIITLPMDLRGTRIYGSILQNCLLTILPKYETGNWYTHSYDRAARDYRAAVKIFKGGLIDISREAHFSYNRKTPIQGLAAFKPISKTGKNVKVVAANRDDIEYLESLTFSDI